MSSIRLENLDAGVLELLCAEANWQGTDISTAVNGLLNLSKLQGK